MKTTNGQLTLENEQTEGQPSSDLQKQMESTLEIQPGNIHTDTSIDVNDDHEKKVQTYMDLEKFIGVDYREQNPNEPYLPLEAVAEKAGIEMIHADECLQHHGYRHWNGGWSEEMLNSGYVVVTSYITQHRYVRAQTRVKKELLSPDAQQLFFALFVSNYW